MGADLIGFLVKGPSNITDKRQEAVDFLKNRNNVVRDYIDALGKLNEDDAVDYNEFFNKDEAILDFLEWRTFDGTHEETAELLNELVCQNPEKTVDDFIQFWENGARDATSRIDPDDKTKVIVFAGEMSYGDEPNGYGYETIRDATYLGLLNFFGIK